MKRIAYALALTFLSFGAALAQNSPPFCPPSKCLYYAGDFDSNDSSANALYNSSSLGSGEGEVWVGVRPTHNVTVTGATFNECMALNEGVGVNPTPFSIQSGIRDGHAGKTVCRTKGQAILKYYETSDVCNQESYRIAKLAKSCKLEKGKNLLREPAAHLQ